MLMRIVWPSGAGEIAAGAQIGDAAARQVVAEGGVFYYLAKIETSCGGTYGNDSAGRERILSGVCPLSVPSQGDH